MKAIKPFIILALLFLSFKTAIVAQTQKIDSLVIELENYKTQDTIRVNLLMDLAKLNYRVDLNKTKTYLEEGEAISEALDFKKGKAKSILIKAMIQATESNYEQGFDTYEEALQAYKALNFSVGIAECYNEMGLFYYRKGNQKEAIEYYEKSLEVNKEINDFEQMFSVLNNIGWSYLQIGDYPNAIHAYTEALKNKDNIKNKTLLSYCLSDLGIIYTYQGNYPQALEYFNRSLVVAQNNADSVAIGNTLGNMGPVYSNLGKFHKAIETFEKSSDYLNNTNKNATASNFNNIGLAYKELEQYQRALQFFSDAQKIYEEINNKPSQGLCLNNIGDVYLELEDYTTAYQYYERARKINLEVKNQRGLCNSYLGMAKVYTNQRQYEKALTYALKSKDLSNTLEILSFQREISELLSQIYERKGEYQKALKSHEQFKILNDSLFNKENTEKIAQLEAEFKYERALDSARIRELKLTQTVTSTSRDLEKSQRNYLWAIIGVLLISILSGFVIFYQKLKNARSKTQNAVIEQKLLRSQMTPHFIFNSLSVLQGMILNKEDKKSVSYLSKFSKLLRITLENSRDKMVSLSDELKAIENYLALQNLENEAYQYSVVVENSVDVPSLLVPPMLIQPFAENAIEHAFVNDQKSKKIDIRLDYSENKLRCTITDNGIGYDQQKLVKNNKKRSLSTTITSERLNILSKDLKMEGSVTIEDRMNVKEKGTRVVLVIPHKIQLAS